MPGDVGDFSVNIGLGINFLAFVSQFVTLRDTLTYSFNVANMLQSHLFKIIDGFEGIIICEAIAGV